MPRMKRVCSGIAYRLRQLIRRKSPASVKLAMQRLWGTSTGPEPVLARWCGAAVGAIHRHREGFFFLILLVLLVPYLLFALHAHPSHDDFCFAYRARDGFLRAQVDQYLTWSGRYTYTFIMSALTLLGPIEETFSHLILFTFIIYFASIILFIRALGPWPSTPLRTIIAGLAVLLTALLTVRQPSEYLFWLSGAIAYPFSFSFLLALVATTVIGVRSSSRWSRRAFVVVSTSLAFLLAGMNETLLLPTLAILLGGLALAWFLGRPAVPFLGTVSAAFLAGTAIALLGPGNAARQSFYGIEPPSPVATALKALVWSGHSVIEWATELALIALPALLFSLLGRICAQDSRRLGPGIHPCLPYGIALVGVAGLVFLAVFPSYHALGVTPRARVANTAYLMFMLGWVPLAFHFIQSTLGKPDFQKWMGRISIASFLILVAALIGSGNFVTVVFDLARMGRFDEQMRARYAFISEQRRAGATDLTLAPVMPGRTHLMFEDISEDPRHWSNACLAGYYQVDSIRLESDPRLPGDG